MEDEEFDDDYKAIPGADCLQAEVPAALAGQRLDVALADLFREYSRSRLQNWVRNGQVLINGQPCGVRDKVWGGEAICLWPELEKNEVDAPEAIPLQVVFEDAALLVIDKPAGLVVHPGNGNARGTLLNGILHHVPANAELPRAGIVHRLDKETSGLLVVAKTLKAHTDLVRQLQARTVKREYLALVHGEIDHDGSVDAPLARDPVVRTRRAVHPLGKRAVTHYRVEERFPGLTLVCCSLETGRTHQIRVHMQHINHPLVGDPVYSRGRRGPASGFPRQALHATRLGLFHPYLGEPLEWAAPLPDDFFRLLGGVRQGRVWAEVC
jgi:23S rRNA pseudouridine1911/1915/1917 synthase